MEYFEVTKTETGFHVEGFPDATKVIVVDGKEAKRLSDLSLHKADLEFADECLSAINQVTEQPAVIREDYGVLPLFISSNVLEIALDFSWLLNGFIKGSLQKPLLRLNTSRTCEINTSSMMKTRTHKVFLVLF